MPIHDWTRVDAGLFHDFHQTWTIALRNALNGGVLPDEYFALAEQRIGGPIPDVLTLNLAGAGGSEEPVSSATALAVKTSPPRTRMVRKRETEIYSDKANRIVVRHRHGQVIAVIEIVSPGDKSSRSETRAFVEKSAELIRRGVHLMVIDLFPPGPRDPQGLAKAIWDEHLEEEFDFPADKPLVQGAFDAGPPSVAYLEPLAVGDALPDLPLFLRPEQYVPAPLEKTYQATWQVFPVQLKGLLVG
jgi:hypothetical protein